MADYTALLRDMQSDIRGTNPERVKAGYQPIELLGWAESPHYEFDQGKRYDHFDVSIDKVAVYGIGALIAGKVAAKAGLLAGGLLLLKEFGVLLLAGLAAVGRGLKTLFVRG